MEYLLAFLILIGVLVWFHELGIVATPTTLVVKDGIIRKVFVGVIKSERILKEV